MVRFRQPHPPPVSGSDLGKRQEAADPQPGRSFPRAQVPADSRQSDLRADLAPQAPDVRLPPEEADATNAPEPLWKEPGRRLALRPREHSAKRNPPPATTGRLPIPRP